MTGHGERIRWQDGSVNSREKETGPKMSRILKVNSPVAVASFGESREPGEYRSPE